MTTGLGAPSARSMITSIAIHVVALLLLLLVPAKVLSNTRTKELDVVFYRPRPPVTVAVPVVAQPPPAALVGPERHARPGPPKPMPPAPGKLPPGAPDMPPVETPAEKVGKVGILAFREKFAGLTQDRVSARLGRDARYSDADAGRPGAPSVLSTSTPGSSGGIDVGSLSRGLGGAGGGGGSLKGGGGGGGVGVEIGIATSPIAPGGDRPLSKGGLGPSRTDEEIQIVFDRYKAQFYRLYNRELRKDPTLQGQMVLRLTIEPDGSVSMCKLQSTDMNAPELAAQVVNITLTINFGAKEGVKALTISYPIDFLPAN
jgi:hypothetical protein